MIERSNLDPTFDLDTIAMAMVKCGVNVAVAFTVCVELLDKRVKDETAIALQKIKDDQEIRMKLLHDYFEARDYEA